MRGVAPCLLASPDAAAGLAGANVAPPAEALDSSEKSSGEPAPSRATHSCGTAPADASSAAAATSSPERRSASALIDDA